MSVKANSETHAILNYEGAQEEENRDTLKNFFFFEKFKNFFFCLPRTQEN